MAGVQLNALERQYWFHDDIPEDALPYHLTGDGDFLLRRNTENKDEILLSVFKDDYGGIEDYHMLDLDRDENPEEESFPSTDDIKKVYKSLMKRPYCKTPRIRMKWMLSSKDISLGEKIGEGCFANVYKATYRDNKETITVAVKEYKDKMSDELKKHFFLEGFILGENNHPNIIKLIGIVAEGEKMMIVTEYLEKGELGKYLRANKDSFCTKDLISMCTDVASGMAYLERKKCFHRDLASRNCLVTDTLRVKISDFGMSRLEEQPSMPSSDGYPLLWTAPEVFKNGDTFTSRSDVWSFGILMWEIFSKGQNPYQDISFENRDDFLEIVIKQGYRMRPPKETPVACYDLMKKCWELLPEDRYNFKEIEKILQEM